MDLERRDFTIYVGVTAQLICTFVFANAKIWFSHHAAQIMTCVRYCKSPKHWDALNEPRHKKTDFCAYAKAKTQISFAVTAKLISVFVFATWILQSLYFLNPKFQVSSDLVWLYSPVCVGPGRKPRRPVFSQRGSNNYCTHL